MTTTTKNHGKCTLSLAKIATISDKTYCFANLGRHRSMDAAKVCRSYNAKLPLPKSSKESLEFTDVLTYIVQKFDIILLDITDNKNEGTVLFRKKFQQDFNKTKQGAGLIVMGKKLFSQTGTTTNQTVEEPKTTS